MKSHGHRRFFGRAADGIFERARAGRDGHGEVDKEGGGGDRVSELSRRFKRAHAMIFFFLLWHLGPSAYWGSTGSSILLPLLWSLVGAVYGAVAKWQSQKQNIELAWNAMMYGKVRALWGAVLTGFLFSGALNISMYYVAKLVSASAGRPRVIFVILVGYLIAGLHYFLRDLCRPVISQPAYVRSGSASIFSMIGGALTWLPATIFSLSYTRGRHLIESMVSWALFIGIVSIGLLIGTL